MRIIPGDICITRWVDFRLHFDQEVIVRCRQELGIIDFFVIYNIANISSTTFGLLFETLFFKKTLLHLPLWGGLAIFLFIDWVVTVKFTLFPWLRSLPKSVKPYSIGS